MRLLYLINLFFVCCSSFIMQPSYSCMSSNLKINNNNIIKSNYLIKFKKEKLINNFINLKKNNEDDNDKNIGNIIIFMQIVNLIMHN
jgi:hypothetical protein